MLFTLRSAVRSVCRAPLVSLVVAGSVGLGVGATTTVFAWMDHLVRNPLPAVDAMERVVSVGSRARGREDGLSYPDYLDLRDATTTLDGMAAFGLRQFGVRRAGDEKEATASVWGMLVTANYFEVLRVRPAAGRVFVADDTRSAGESPVAIVSHRFARKFGGAARSVGAQLRVNGSLVTVVGVAPPEFAGTYTGLAFDLWLPVASNGAVGGNAAHLESRSLRWLQGIARLRDGTSLAAARADLAGAGARLRRLHAESAEHDAFVKPLDTGAAQRLRTLFMVLFGMTGLVSLIVCTNVANLLMMRGAARARELGIRLSLGASRSQLFAQLFTEAAILAAAGASLGAVLARYAQDLLAALMPPSPLPLALGGRWDVSMLLFALATGIVMVMVFGLVPALHTIGGSVPPNTSRGDLGTTRRSARLRTGLVVAQLSLSMAALTCCGAFLRVNDRLAEIDRGIDRPEKILLASTELDQAGYHIDDVRVATAERLLERVRALPGVESAALATFVPLGFAGYASLPVTVPGYSAQPEEDLSVLVNRVTAGYFETLGIAMRTGRAIDRSDAATSPPVVVVNDAFVRRYLRTNALGQRFQLGARQVTVIGVAADGKYQFDALDKPAPPFVYLPYAQEPRPSITLHVRAADLRSAADAVRRAFATVDPALPVNAITTLDEYTSLPLFPVRLASMVLGWLGVAALVLASTGLYGVLAYRVSQRRRELALRMAVGAGRARVIRLVLREGVVQAFTGLAIGSALAVAVTHLIAARLPRVTAIDPPVLAMSAILLIVVASVAAGVPALRATRIETSLVLKGE